MVEAPPPTPLNPPAAPAAPSAPGDKDDKDEKIARKRAAVRENANYYTEKASEVFRQLAFAGLGLLWIFKDEDTPAEAFVREIIPSATLLVAALMLDALHYVWGSRIWAAAARDGSIGVPKRALGPLIRIFWLKLVTLGLAYVAVVAFVYRRAGY